MSTPSRLSARVGPAPYVPPQRPHNEPQATPHMPPTLTPSSSTGTASSAGYPPAASQRPHGRPLSGGPYPQPSVSAGYRPSPNNNPMLSQPYRPNGGGKTGSDYTTWVQFKRDANFIHCRVLRIPCAFRFPYTSSSTSTATLPPTGSLRCTSEPAWPQLPWTADIHRRIYTSQRRVWPTICSSPRIIPSSCSTRRISSRSGRIPTAPDGRRIPTSTKLPTLLDLFPLCNVYFLCHYYYYDALFCLFFPFLVFAINYYTCLCKKKSTFTIYAMKGNMAFLLRG